MVSGRKPPAGPMRKDSTINNSLGSKAALNIDTTSVQNQSAANQSPRGLPDSKGTAGTGQGQGPPRNLATKQSSTNSSPKHS